VLVEIRVIQQPVDRSNAVDGDVKTLPTHSVTTDLSAELAHRITFNCCCWNPFTIKMMILLSTYDALYTYSDSRKKMSGNTAGPLFARDIIYAIARIMLSPVCLSVCLSVTRVDQSKTVEVRIMQLSAPGI